MLQDDSFFVNTPFDFVSLDFVNTPFDFVPFDFVPFDVCAVLFCVSS
jgi:hypothetical protein